MARIATWKLIVWGGATTIRLVSSTPRRIGTTAGLAPRTRPAVYATGTWKAMTASGAMWPFRTVPRERRDHADAEAAPAVCRGPEHAGRSRGCGRRRPVFLG